MGTSWYDVVYNGIPYQKNIDACNNGTEYHIDEEWAHAQQQYSACQHLVRSRERIDSQSGKSLGSACDVSRSSTCRLMFNRLSLTGRPEHGQKLQDNADPIECNTAAQWNSVRSAQDVYIPIQVLTSAGCTSSSECIVYTSFASSTHSVRHCANEHKFEEVP